MTNGRELLHILGKGLEGMTRSLQVIPYGNRNQESPNKITCSTNSTAAVERHARNMITQFVSDSIGGFLRIAAM